MRKCADIKFLKICIYQTALGGSKCLVGEDKLGKEDKGGGADERICEDNTEQ